ncbi:MAG TPA: FecR domain-containing protein [Polyangiaceae bacterium]|nr:FecR domain-containing protein [Polyangiaceae bacterium]
MNHTPRDPGRGTLERLGQALAREQDELPLRAELRAEVRARLLAKGSKRRRSAQLRRFGALLAATLVLSLAFGFVFRSLKRGAASVQVGHGELSASAGTWLHASESEPLPLTFADGTRIEMAPRSRARVLVLDPKETRVMLESGHAHVEVMRRAGQNFSITTGPFTVHVTGTRFDVGWNPEHDQFELTLAEGQVELSGCVFGNGRKLVAGQRVEASCKVPRLEIAYSAPASPPSASAAASETPVASAATLGGAAPVARAQTEPTRAPKPALPSGGGWVSMARAGRYAEAFAAADREGFAELCQGTSAAELSLLGETARHAGRLGEARQAFTALRRRFPAAKEAGLSAFSLGLLEFDGFSAYSKAADWFRTYLRENPSGPLARDARGRLMEATQRSGSRAEARELARSYLLDYPAGPHAELARRIVSSP